MRSSTPLMLLVMLAALPASAQTSVQPVLETQPAVRGGNNSPDPAFWRDATFPNRSLLITADPTVGLITYQLNGSEFQVFQSDGVMAGVDVIDAFPLSSGTTPLVVAASSTRLALSAYVVDPSSRALSRVDLDTLRVSGFDPRTVTLFRSGASGRFYAFMANSGGTVQQLELRATEDGGVDGTAVRDFNVGGAITAATVDSQQGVLFVVEPNTGILRFSAEPDGGTTGTTAVATAGLGGLAVYAVDDQSGYLLAANAQGDLINVYDRRAPHGLVGSFTVQADGGIDPVNSPRFVEISSLPVGTGFPQGLVAVHDSSNDTSQNYKLVSWATLANAFSPPLQVRGATPDGGTPDAGGADGGPDGGGTDIDPGGGGSVPVEDGCGCTSASVPGTVLFVLVGLALRGRRRQQG